MDLNSVAQSTKQNLLDLFQLAITYDHEELKDPNIYLGLMEKICEVNHAEESSKKALEIARNQLTVADFEKVYKKELAKETKKFNVKQCAEYDEFKNALDRRATQTAGLSSRTECDEFVMESGINIYDPLTKQRMQNPVRNTLCGHRYEKSSVLEAIAINSNLRCPVAGCGNRSHILKSHLIDDDEFRVHLQSMGDSEDPLE